MAHPFRPYEVGLLEHLLAEEFAPARLSEVLDTSSGAHVEYNGYGFYVSVRHPEIGATRRAYSALPSSAGHCEGRMAGFIAFLDDNQLTLEIYPWDGDCLPATFRDGDVRIGP